MRNFEPRAENPQARNQPARNKPARNKADLAKVVYDLHGGLTRHEAQEVVEKILGTMKTSLLEGRQVKIQNFGVFEVKQRQGRRGVDPVNHREIFIPPRQGLNFRPSQRLKSRVERGGHSS